MGNKQTSMETETIKEGIEKKISEIINRHKSAMHNELKPYYAELERIAAFDTKPKPVFIPQKLLDGMSDEQKRETLKLMGVS